MYGTSLHCNLNLKFEKFRITARITQIKQYKFLVNHIVLYVCHHHCKGTYN